MTADVGSGGDQRPTLIDVANASGVSKSTVSRVINERGYVSAPSRAAVERAMEQLGYVPNSMARSLRTNRTNTVGFVVPTFVHEAYYALAEGADSRLAPTGRTMLLSTSGYDVAREHEVIRRLRERKVDGLILSLASDRSPGIGKVLLEYGSTPMVLVDRDVDGLDAADRIYVDNGGLAQAAAALEQAGHRRVMLVAPTTDVRSGREAARVFRESFPEGRVAHVPLTVETGRRVLTEALADGEAAPTAVVLAGANVLTGALQALHAQAIPVPEGMSLVAYDVSRLALVNSPPQIDSIDRDTIGMGSTAADLLLSRLDGRAEPEIVEVTTRYRSVGSVVPPGRG